MSLTEIFGKTAGGLLDFAGSQGAMDAVKDTGQFAFDQSQVLGQQAVDRSKFRPFSVTANTGSATTDAAGGTNVAINPQLQALQEALFGASSGFLGSATTPLADRFSSAQNAFGLGNTGVTTQSILQQLGIGGPGREDDIISKVLGTPAANREQQIFEQLEAMQAPGRSRDALALEERLFNQGRGEVQTSAYGGTPEQLARAKAVEESRLGSAVQAGDIARSEQAQRAQQVLQSLGLSQGEQGLFGNLGLSARGQALSEGVAGSSVAQAASDAALRTQAQETGLATDVLKSGFIPQEALMALLNSGVNIADIAATGDRQGAQLAAGLGQTGLESKVESEAVAATIKQRQMAALAELLSGTASSTVKDALGNVTTTPAVQGLLAGIVDLVMGN